MFDARHAPYRISAEVARLLEARYTERHRAYHDLTHIAELLRWFDAIADDAGWDAPRDVYDAILFHDAIYDPLAPSGDNEARSAELAEAHGASARAADLIRLTARHGKLAAADVDRDAARFLDADVAIVGAAPAAFDRYDAAIAIEYGQVPAAAFRAGRRKFLETLLARPRIYLTDYFHARLDAAARANLARALSRYAP